MVNSLSKVSEAVFFTLFGKEKAWRIERGWRLLWDEQGAC